MISYKIIKEKNYNTNFTPKFTFFNQSNSNIISGNEEIPSSPNKTKEMYKEKK